MATDFLIVLYVLAFLVVLVLVRAFRILREYERGVIFLLGRFWRVKGPGLILVIPLIQSMVRVSLRTIVLDVPTQDIISRDNVTAKVNAVIYYRVVDPQRAIIEVEDFHFATSQLAQTTLRSVLGQHQLDDMLAAREQLNTSIRNILDDQTAAWGIKVSNVELKHVDLDPSMIRAIAREAEAERLRRAKVISAQGEAQAAENILQAARILHEQPEAIQIRYLTAMLDMAGDKTSTVIFPLPIDVLANLNRRAPDGS